MRTVKAPFREAHSPHPEISQHTPGLCLTRSRHSVSVCWINNCPRVPSSLLLTWLRSHPLPVPCVQLNPRPLSLLSPLNSAPPALLGPPCQLVPNLACIGPDTPVGPGFALKAFVPFNTSWRPTCGLVSQWVHPAAQLPGLCWWPLTSDGTHAFGSYAWMFGLRLMTACLDDDSQTGNSFLRQSVDYGQKHVNRDFSYFCRINLIVKIRCGSSFFQPLFYFPTQCLPIIVSHIRRTWFSTYIRGKEVWHQ